MARSTSAASSTSAKSMKKTPMAKTPIATKHRVGAASAASLSADTPQTPLATDGGSTPGTPAALSSLPFSDPPLGDVDEFVKDFPLYKHMVVTVYQIVRDLHIKQEVTNIEIVDGRRWGRKQYFIKATSRIDGRQRLLVPIGLDEDVALPWIHSLCEESERNDVTLFICLHTPESIVYETLHTELP